MSLSGLLSIARSGLAAQTGALTVTGQNVANATTVGYTRRVAQLTPVVGGGVSFDGGTRSINAFANARVVDQQGQKGSADARSAALSSIESIVAPPDNTIGDRATALVSSFNTLAAYPLDQSVRTDTLAKASDFASTIASTARQLADTSKDLFSQAQSTVGEINGRLQQIADLNSKIADAQAQGGDTGTLRDQRDQYVSDVGQRIGVRSVEDAQGRVTLFAAGAALVSGNNASPLTLDLDGAGAMRLTVQGASAIDVTSRVDAGTLGGLCEARDVDLVNVQNNLDSYAYDVSNGFNAVHAAGYGTDGGTGRNLFTAPATQAGAATAMSVDASMVGHPESIASAGSSAELPGGNSAAAALAQIGDQATFGGATLANRFANITTDIGTRKNAADADVTLRTDTLAVAQTLSDSASGVSVDEEMIDVTRYQRAFQASSKVLQTADGLLDDFLRSF